MLTRALSVTALCFTAIRSHFVELTSSVRFTITNGIYLPARRASGSLQVPSKSSFRLKENNGCFKTAFFTYFLISDSP